MNATKGLSLVLGIWWLKKNIPVHHFQLILGKPNGQLGHKMSNWMSKCYFMGKHSKYRRYTRIKLRHSRLWEFHASLRSVIMLQVCKTQVHRHCIFSVPISVYHDFVLTNWWWTTACIHSECQFASQSWGRVKFRAHAGHHFKRSLESTQRKSCFHPDSFSPTSSLWRNSSCHTKSMLESLKSDSPQN